MGITDSKMLAEKVLTACKEAQKQGKSKLDADSFWSDEVGTSSDYIDLDLTKEGIRGCKKSFPPRTQTYAWETPPERC